MRVNDCAALLRGWDDILLVTHRNPDGDTVGSAAALCSALRRLGKRAWLYPNREINVRLRRFAEPYLALDAFQGAHCVAVDVANEKMLADGFSQKVELCIDHHPSNSHYAEKTLLDDKRAACGEIVLRLIEALCGAPDKTEADLLYIALSTDCGCFQYANTDAHALRSAAKLLDAGAESAALNQLFFRRVSRARLKLEGLVYDNLSFHRDGAVVVAIITQAMLRAAGAAEGDLDDLAGLAGRAEGHRVSITIRENADGTSRVSARSGPDFDCCALCAVFGGGGHKMAAGCEIKAAPEKARELLLQVVDEVWQ